MTPEQFIFWLEGVLASHDTIQPSMHAKIIAKIAETRFKPVSIPQVKNRRGDDDGMVFRPRATSAQSASADLPELHG